MKRTTILIYKDSTDPKKGLKEATQKEWSAILKSNKGLPMNIYIDVTKELKKKEIAAFGSYIEAERQITASA